MRIVAREVRRAGVIDRVTIQSFDSRAQNGKLGDPDYVPYTTPQLVTEAHAAGMAVIPWTIDDPATMDAGVDGTSRTTPIACGR